ncbi:hypothetical protein EK21DRAFT_76086 [Setomelanomma holmii]|uniref:Uncharacterized protein n=1 Tax=Setomelanomma holmii TaxID=210430 RepID=A0A9P4H2L8_9PLEO|nr:hypothetical protein EK21DRAFT_76086 [Setomelanomma holmii]
MKTFTTITAIMGLVAIAAGTAGPRDGDVKDTVTDTQATRCQQCSKIFTDCAVHCGTADCSNNCRKVACNSYVDGLRCGTVCLWYC